MKKNVLLLAILLFHLSGIAQEKKSEIIPYMKIGVGYFNDGLMIDGSEQLGEIGFKQSNGFLFSLNFRKAETLNDKGFFDQFGFESYNFIYTYTVTTIYFGYEFIGKGMKHVFIPQMGAFYSNQKKVYPTFINETQAVIKKIHSPNIGVAISLDYHFCITKNIAIGLNACGYVAYQMGPIYYSASPVVIFSIQ